ncbi:MAG: hypothetical protein KGI06_01735 [Candidatus Micrarchaeota archaeon]|nr:hypothetical protein [Candidatus Micrarchaeota archaeon]
MSEKLTRSKVKKIEQNEMQVEDRKTYAITFPTRKSRIDGNYILMGIYPGTSSSMSDDGQDVTVAKGYQVKVLDKLGIPWEFFKRKSNGNSKSVALRR